jgi:hypothetical protein
MWLRLSRAMKSMKSVVDSRVPTCRPYADTPARRHADTRSARLPSSRRVLKVVARSYEEYLCWPAFFYVDPFILSSQRQRFAHHSVEGFFPESPNDRI